MFSSKVLTAGTMAMSLLAVPAGSAAQAAPLGDTSACAGAGDSAIRANIFGLKDRVGELKLELYPANDDDFLKDDRDLLKQGKLFRRIRVPTPASGPVSLCMKVPGPGRYALLFTHNRDGKNKFSIWDDGAGFPSNVKLGRSRPKLAMAMIDVGHGVTVTNIRAQYLRGLGGFAPLSDGS